MLPLLEKGVEEVFLEFPVYVEDETERAFKKIMPFLIQNVNPDGVAYRKIK